MRAISIVSHVFFGGTSPLAQVPYKYRAMFPPDPDCAQAPQDASTCCGFTDVSHSQCAIHGLEGVCKCNGGATARLNTSLHCPAGGQCSREYMLAMLAVSAPDIYTHTHHVCNVTF